jgi:hypothetical protein
MSLQKIMLILLCLVWASTLRAQDSLLYSRLTIDDTLCTLNDALKIIEQKTGLSFSYNSELINKQKIVALHADNEKLVDVLIRMFDDNTLNYTVISNHLVVFRPVKTRAVNPDSKRDTVKFLEIRGRVLDKENQQPLSFSSVYLVGKTIGTISNEEGEFVLKLDTAQISEILSISCIGYKNFSAPVSFLVNSTHDYLLETDVVSIQEVIIRKISPVYLLQSANKRIRENYSQHPIVLTSFYRETLQRGNRYMLVSEALLESYKTSYNSIGSDQVKILKGRRSEDFSKTDSVILKLKAGLNAMIMLDVVKYTPDFLSDESFGDYIYRMADIVIEDGRDHYAIEFSPRKGSTTAIYSGRVLIDIKDMAYRWVEFHVSNDKLDQATNLFILKKPARLVVKVLKANYKVAFRKSGNKYYLNLIQGETEFRIRKRNQLSGSVYGTRLEMAVTEIDTSRVRRFPFRETARPHEFFTDQLGTYDESFWGEYNFITPDKSLEQALIKLNKIQQAAQKNDDMD